jgi:hypothetical protein
MFGALKDRHGAATLSEVKRQHKNDERRAAEMMAEGNYHDALGIYQAKGAIHWTRTQREARAALVEQWAKAIASMAAPLKMPAFLSIEIGLIEGPSLPSINGPRIGMPKFIERRRVEVDRPGLAPVEPYREMAAVVRLTVVADQDELGAGAVGVRRHHGHEFGVDHGGFVEDDGRFLCPACAIVVERKELAVDLLSNENRHRESVKRPAGRGIRHAKGKPRFRFKSGA